MQRMDRKIVYLSRKIKVVAKAVLAMVILVRDQDLIELNLRFMDKGTLRSCRSLIE